MIELIDDIKYNTELGFKYASEEDEFLVLHPLIINKQKEKMQEFYPDITKVNADLYTINCDSFRYNATFAKALNKDSRKIEYKDKLIETTGIYGVFVDNQSKDNYLVKNLITKQIIKKDIISFTITSNFPNDIIQLLDKDKQEFILVPGGLINFPEPITRININKDKTILIYTSNNIYLINTKGEIISSNKHYILNYRVNVLNNFELQIQSQAKNNINQRIDLYEKYLIRKLQDLPELKNMPSSYNNFEDISKYLIANNLNLVINLRTSEIIFSNFAKGITIYSNYGKTFINNIEELKDATNNYIRTRKK